MYLFEGCHGAFGGGLCGSMFLGWFYEGSVRFMVSVLRYLYGFYKSRIACMRVLKRGMFALWGRLHVMGTLRGVGGRGLYLGSLGFMGV